MKREPRELGVVAEVSAFLLAAMLAGAPVAAHSTGKANARASRKCRSQVRKQGRNAKKR
jgi:hypothetical protein